MTLPEPTVPDPIIGQIHGSALLRKLDDLTEAVHVVDRKVDPIPGVLSEIKDNLRDHETRIRTLEQVRHVSWTHLGAVLTLVLTALAVVAAFAAIH